MQRLGRFTRVGDADSDIAFTKGGSGSQLHVRVHVDRCRLADPQLSRNPWATMPDVPEPYKSILFALCSRSIARRSCATSSSCEVSDNDRRWLEVIADMITDNGLPATMSW